MSRSRKDGDGPVAQLSVPKSGGRDRSVSMGRSPSGVRSISLARSEVSMATSLLAGDFVPSSSTLSATGRSARNASPMFRHAATLCPAGGRNRSKSREKQIIIVEDSYNPAQGNETPAELTTFKTSCQIFTQMMSTLQPGKESPEDRKLLKDMSQSSRFMKDRVVQLLESKEYPNFTVDLLRLNDELNLAMYQYDKFCNSSEAASQKDQQKVAPQQKNPAIVVGDDAD